MAIFLFIFLFIYLFLPIQGFSMYPWLASNRLPSSGIKGHPAAYYKILLYLILWHLFIMRGSLVHAQHSAFMELSRQLLGVSFSAIWVLGFELGSSDLVGSTFIC